MDIAGIHLGVFDLISLGILAFFFILGIMKGFIFQAVRLVTILVALIVAKAYAGSAEPGAESGLTQYLVDWFPNQFDGEESRKFAVYIAFFLIFAAVFILGTLIGFLLRSMLKKLELRSFDRFLGGLLGILVGAALIVVIVSLIVSVSQDANLVEKMNQSHTLKFSTKVIQLAQPFFPETMREKIDEVLEKIDTDEERKLPPPGAEEGGESPGR